MDAKLNMSSAASLEAAVRALGSRFDPEILAATRAIYDPHTPFDASAAQADVRYGPHERNRLDIYLPSKHARGIVVYVHGGGFVGGDKAFVRNIGQFFSSKRFATVVLNYRLAPECPWPSGAKDVQRAMEWVHVSMERFGSSTLPVFAMGHSAGASHVASWLFDAEARGGALPRAAGVLLVSGFYKASHPLANHIAAYFGNDPESYAVRSPLSHVRAIPMPMWLGVAELDPGRIASHTFELAHAVTIQDGHGLEFEWLRGHNHVSTVLSIGSPQEDVGEKMLRFLVAHQ